jgi:hypothetical protein
MYLDAEGNWMKKEDKQKRRQLTNQFRIKRAD